VLTSNEPRLVGKHWGVSFAVSPETRSEGIPRTDRVLRNVLPACGAFSDYGRAWSHISFPFQLPNVRLTGAELFRFPSKAGKLDVNTKQENNT
jgi:hypothetical protein